MVALILVHMAETRTDRPSAPSCVCGREPAVKDGVLLACGVSPVVEAKVSWASGSPWKLLEQNNKQLVISVTIILY